MVSLNAMSTAWATNTNKGQEKSEDELDNIKIEVCNKEEKERVFDFTFCVNPEKPREEYVLVLYDMYDGKATYSDYLKLGLKPIKAI